MKASEALERAADVARVLRSSAAFKRRTYASRAKLDEYRRERLQEIFALASTTPLFRERCKSSNPRLEDVEPFDKAKLMERFDDGITAPDLRLADVERYLYAEIGSDGPPFLKSKYVVLFTSGSSALRGAMVYDRDVIALNPAMLMARFTHDRARRARPRIASLLAPDARHGSGFFAKFIPRPLSDNHMFAAAADLTPIAKAIDALDPDIVSAYPSAALRLAELQAEGKIHLRPSAVWCGGEVLAPKTRQRVSEVFGCPVRNMYGMTEGGYVGADCSAGRLHIAEDLVHLEVVDADLRPVKDGEQGEYVLVTHLHNRVQPLVRYRVDDRVTMGVGACPCGSAHRWLASVEGRSGITTTFHVPDKAGQPCPIMGWDIHSEVLDDPDVVGAQVTLRGDDHLDVALLLRKGAEREAVAERCRALTYRLVERAGADPARLRVTARATDELERLPSGKTYTYRAVPAPSP